VPPSYQNYLVAESVSPHYRSPTSTQNAVGKGQNGNPAANYRQQAQVFTPMTLDMMKNKQGSNTQHAHPLVGNLFQNINGMGGGGPGSAIGGSSSGQAAHIGGKKQSSFIPSLQANALNQSIGLHPQAHTTTNKGNQGKGRSFSRATDGPGGVTSPKNYRAIYNNQRKNNVGGSAGGQMKQN